MAIRVVIFKKKIYIKIVDANSDGETINVFACYQRGSFYFHDIHIRNSDFDVRIVENVRTSIDNFYEYIIRKNRLDYQDYIYYIISYIVSRKFDMHSQIAFEPYHCDRSLPFSS